MPHPLTLIDAIKNEHSNHRVSLIILKDEKSSFKCLKKAFAVLVPEFISHIRREESIVYKFMLDHHILKPLALEGHDEHQIIEDLLLELQSKTIVDKKIWRAKVNVFAELVEHHTTEEEKMTLPALQSHLNLEIDAKLYTNYKKENIMNKLNTILAAAAFIISVQYSQLVKAEETVLEKTEVATDKISNSAKKAYRSAQDKGCEMVDGKLQCLGKKIKHKAQNLSDDAATKAKEIKNKTK